MSYDVVDLASDLIRFPSVTPRDAGVLDYLADRLSMLGFECFMLPFGDGPERVENLFARYGRRGPHLCYAGHTDVVPPGPEDQWRFGPFNPHIEDGILYGRGASDMKGSVAAFVAAVAAYLQDGGIPKGSISLLITGDEEGPAINGTVKVLEWMEAHGQLPDVALVGEPTNPDHLGQEVKIGRRGSLSGILTVNGVQGHVAYPHRADNPLPKLVRMLDDLNECILDKGSAYFPQSNLEITSIDVGNKVDNVIPARGVAKFNIRFNDRWTSESLSEKIHKILDATGYAYDLHLTCGAESFLTQPGEWSNIVARAVEDVTGNKPAFTTNGGTSDARFIARYCPVVEFGGVNETVHRIDENAKVEDLQYLARVFRRILESYFR